MTTSQLEPATTKDPGSTDPTRRRRVPLPETESGLDARPGNQALTRADPRVLLAAGGGNQALVRAAGGVEVAPDPLADPSFNPETIVNELARAIDSHDTYVRHVPGQQPPPGGFGYAQLKYEEVRKIDGAKVIQALADLTAGQAAYVGRLYAQRNENRSLEQDLFGGGGSATASDLRPETIARISALLRGTKRDRPNAGEPPGKIDADAAELRQLLQLPLGESGRERVMSLLRRPAAANAVLSTAYLMTFSRVLLMDLLQRLAPRQYRRATLLIIGDPVGADAVVVEEKLAAIDQLDKQRADLSDWDSVMMRPQLASKRAGLVGDLQALTTSRPPEEVSRLLAAATTTGGTVEQHLRATLSVSAAGAIVARARGDVVAAAAAQMVELERNHQTHTDKITPILRGLRTAAQVDLQKLVYDERVPPAERERVAGDPSGELNRTATAYVQRFVSEYDAQRGAGRTWQQIVDSADTGNKDLLTALVAGGGQATGPQELEFAISRGKPEPILAALANRDPDSSPQQLRRAYDAAPRFPGSLELRLFGPRGPAFAAATSESNWMIGKWLLHGRDAARAAELLGRPVLGGAAEVEWLSRGASAEVGASENTSGVVGEVRSWGELPETQALMRRSARELAQLKEGFDATAPGAAAELARARRLRATVTGDVTAYEEENEAIRNTLKEAVSFALTMAIGLAIPGLGYGFALSLALNVAGTIATNALIYGSDYDGTRFCTDLFGGLLGGLGGKLGEEVVGAVAARVAQRAAPAVAGAAERAGLATALKAEAKNLVVTPQQMSLLEKAGRWGGDYAGSTAVQSGISGQNEFGLSSLAQNAGTGLLGKMVHRGPKVPGSSGAEAEPAAVPRTAEVSTATELVPAPASSTRSTGAEPSRPPGTPEPRSPGEAPTKPVEEPPTTKAAEEEILDLDAPENRWRNEDSVAAQPPPHEVTDPVASRAMFEGFVAGQPTLESALLRNSVTGEHIIVQGAPGSVDIRRGHGVWEALIPPSMRGTGSWDMVVHSHPVDATGVTPVGARVPSGAGGDFAWTVYQAATSGKAVTQEIRITVEGGRAETTRYGYDPNHRQPYSIDVPGPNGRITERFATIEDYHDWYAQNVRGGDLGAVPAEFAGARRSTADWGIDLGPAPAGGHPGEPGRPAGTSAPEQPPAAPARRRQNPVDAIDAAVTRTSSTSDGLSSQDRTALRRHLASARSKTARRERQAELGRLAEQLTVRPDLLTRQQQLHLVNDTVAAGRRVIEAADHGVTYERDGRELQTSPEGAQSQVEVDRLRAQVEREQAEIERLIADPPAFDPDSPVESLRALQAWQRRIDSAARELRGLGESRFDVIEHLPAHVPDQAAADLARTALAAHPDASAIEMLALLRTADLDTQAVGRLGEGIPRGGREDVIPTAGALARLGTDPPGLGPQLAALFAGYQRAHLIGPGFGSEHGVGVAFAPHDFNQLTQNKGIERVLRAWEAAGADLQVSVRATATRHVIPLASGGQVHIDVLTGVTYEIQRYGSGGEPMGGVRTVEYAIGGPPDGATVVVHTDIPGLTADGFQPLP